MASRIRKGDVVAVISGDDRGKRGRVLRVIPEAQKVVVEGVNLVYKHMRKSQKSPQGGRVRREAPIHACKVLPVDPESNRPTRIGYRTEDGRKVRFGRRTGAALGQPPRKGEKAEKGEKGAGKGRGAAPAQAEAAAEAEAQE